MKIKSLILSILTILAVTSCGDGKKADNQSDCNKVTAGVENADAMPSESTLDNPQFKVVDNVIISDNLPVVVDFYATWCGPCKVYAPVFTAVGDQYKNAAVFVRIDAEEYPELAKTYGVNAYPTTAFISTGGELLGSKSGAMNEEELTTFVNQLIATTAGADMEL